MTPEDRNHQLRRLLRAGDPAAGPGGLAPNEVAAMRRRVLASATGEARSLVRWLAPAATAAALLALALGVASHRPPAPAPAADVAPVAARQIQFTTGNGTLVVWQLQPREPS